uniref:Protein FAR1-RELATED SEQUENCE n=1 Tax=Setaria italica TaxID=4555 RepID=K3XT86_SETIT
MDVTTPSATTEVFPVMLTAQSPESTQVRCSAPLAMLMTEGTAARSLPTTSQCPAPVLSASSAVIPGRLAAVTPLQHVSPETMATPHPERTFLHPGKAVREKISMRCECKAFVKIKWNIKKDYWFFERIRLEHNHPLHPLTTVTQFLRIQKDKDPIGMDIVDQMHRCDASHNTIVNMLVELDGSRQNFTFTKMEFKNRKAATAREERENALLQDEQANTSECLFGAFKNCMSGSRDPRCILTDQDSSMAAAIKEVFRQTQHRLCRWHMLRKYKEELKKLYKIHDEFESTWNELVDEYGIQEDDTIQGLWKSRKLWVVAYLKPLYCGFTKNGFIGHLTCISKFAHRMLNFIQHTNHTAAGELHWSQAGNLWLTLQPFDGHLSRVYTRAVYKKYRETYIYSTAFRIDPYPNEVDVYMVMHTDQSWQYAWFQHSFRVEADVRSEYILKRYTRSARTMVMWERHDIVTSGPGYESDQYKTKKLIEIAMAAMRACRKISLGFEKGCAIQISECAPREARTKGRKRGGKQVVNNHASSNKAQGQWTCGYCGSLGHYSTGCDVNPDNVNKKRGASGSLRGKMGRERGRPPTKRQLEDEFDDVA